MQVLGDLIRLTLGVSSIPLPWWYRAPLGLLHNTPVFVALVEPAPDRPVADLVITTLDPSKWDKMIRVSCSRADGVGVVADVIKSVLPLKVLPAESVTLPGAGGRVHHVDLICKCENHHAVKNEIARIKGALRRLRFKSVDVKRAFPEFPSVVWNQTALVDHGWIHGTDWLEQLRSLYSRRQRDEVDLARLVMSADTELRILHCVFPRKGAKGLVIRHADDPRTMEVLTRVLAHCRLNLLSAFSRRRIDSPWDAELVVVCEPRAGANFNAEAVGHCLRKVLPRYRAKVEISNGRHGNEAIYPRHPEELIARIPSDLAAAVWEAKKNLSPGRYPVFFARRFHRDPRYQRIVNRVRDVLKRKGCAAVEALPDTVSGSAPRYQVSAKLWVSKAGIILVAGIGSRIEDAFSLNLAHELGFLQGQVKPLLLLIEEGSQDSLKSFTNMNNQISTELFASGDGAFDPENPRSIDSIVSRWARGVTQQTAPQLASRRLHSRAG